MTSFVQKLTASGGPESVGFLNDLVAHLWPHIGAAGADMAKKIAEPMFAEMLPGPLATLHFAKIDLGRKPIQFHNVDVHQVGNGGVKLDLDVHWDGECDIEMDGRMIPKVGIEKIKLFGRLSVLLCPLLNVMPIVGAAQVAFINPPSIEMKFTNAASIADVGLIEKGIRGVMQSIICSMAVLPNRFLVKLDPTSDFFLAHQPNLGVVRVIVEAASNVNIATKSGGVSGLIGRIVKDVPDCYCTVTFANQKWKTTTKKDQLNPQWNEAHDYVLSDHDQTIAFEVKDADTGSDDDVGVAETTVKQLLLAGGRQELTLVHNSSNTSTKLVVAAQIFEFAHEVNSLQALAPTDVKDNICGMASILIAGASGIQGQRANLFPNVKVTWGKNAFATATKTDSVGVDVANPVFDQAFNVPITSALLSAPPSFTISLCNKKEVIGTKEFSFQDVISSPNMILENRFDMGAGASVRARISVCGIRPAQ